MADSRGEYRSIYVALADDPDFLALSPPARLSLLMLKLTLGASGIGVVRALAPEVVALTGHPPDVVEDAIAELVAGEWIRVEGHVVWLRNGLRFEPSDPLASENGRRGISKRLDALPKLKIVNDFAAYYDLPAPFPDVGAPRPPYEGGTLPPLGPPSPPPTRAGMRDEGRGMRDEGDVTPSSRSAAPTVDGAVPLATMHEVFVEVLGGPSPPYPALTAKRKQKYRLLWAEHLKGAGDWRGLWRALLEAVRDSEHHAKKRAWQMPESFLMNPERRERWILEARERLEGGPTLTDADRRLLRRRRELEEIDLEASAGVFG